MHMADALTAPAVAGVMYAASIGAAAYSLSKISKEDNSKKIPTMGIMGAFVFAAQMINFSIPGTGSSGHLCGGMMLTAILGPYYGFLTMIGILLVQCLLFADGGLLALGANIWNMSFYGCFIGAAIWKAITKNGMSKKKIIGASVAGCMLTLQLGAFSVVLETMISGITELPFAAFAAAMQPIHLAIGFVEGLITSAVLCFIYEARPEILWGGGASQARFAKTKTLGMLAAAAAVTGGIISLFASSHPDGLEWSIERLTGSADVAAEGGIYALAEKIRSITSILPDYAFKGSDSAAGTSFSGIVGAAIVAAVCALFCIIVKSVRKNANGQN